MFSVFNKIKRSKNWSVDPLDENSNPSSVFSLKMNYSDDNWTETQPPTEYYYIDGDIDAVLYQRYEKNRAVSELVIFLVLAHSANVQVPQIAACTHTHIRCSTLGWAPGLTHKHNSRLERSARDKHSSLLRTFVNYGRNSFITFKCLK